MLSVPRTPRRLRGATARSRDKLWDPSISHITCRMYILQIISLPTSPRPDNVNCERRITDSLTIKEEARMLMEDPDLPDCA